MTPTNCAARSGTLEPFPSCRDDATGNAQSATTRTDTVAGTLLKTASVPRREGYLKMTLVAIHALQDAHGMPSAWRASRPVGKPSCVGVDARRVVSLSGCLNRDNEHAVAQLIVFCAAPKGGS